jgi:hypothetical protein
LEAGKEKTFLEEVGIEEEEEEDELGRKVTGEEKRELE